MKKEIPTFVPLGLSRKIWNGMTNPILILNLNVKLLLSPLLQNGNIFKLYCLKINLFIEKTWQFLPYLYTINFYKIFIYKKDERIESFIFLKNLAQKPGDLTYFT
jgi:hypothetical protein